jgi:Uncharacterized conserved protein
MNWVANILRCKTPMRPHPAAAARPLPF